MSIAPHHFENGRENTEPVECNNCGKTGGKEGDDGQLHCGGCGRFAVEAEQYCALHDMDYSRLTGYDHCPQCREEQRLQAQQQEMHARRASERMHQTVDAPRF